MTGHTIPTFVFAPQASTGLTPYAVELADMDGDGDLDFVEASGRTVNYVYDDLYHLT